MLVDSRSKKQQFPWDYFTLYPLVLLMNACAVFDGFVKTRKDDARARGDSFHYAT